jgi:hypothetical protein
MKASLFRSITVFVCASLLCTPTTASAQVAASLSALESSLEPGDRLRITDRSGIVTDGKLLRVSQHSLQLAVPPGGVLDIAESSLTRVERVTRGTRKGALIGSFLGVSVGMVGLASLSSLGPGPRGAELVLPITLFAGIGAGIGSLIGSTRSTHRLVYIRK